MKKKIDNLVELLVDKVMLEFIEVEASGRHVHLNRAAINQLFGLDYQLTKARPLSQPGQFVCKERVAIEGPKGRIENVVVLGPERKESQVEVSLTDAVALGVKAPTRESGNISGTPSIKLTANFAEIQLPFGLIVAKRHVHMSLKDARRFKVSDQELVQVQVFGERPVIFDDVLIRASDNFRTYMHIDYDEANACGCTTGTLGRIMKKST
jgi:putative phosphotransacetylase